jgi:hypothetical protein
MLPVTFVGDSECPEHQLVPTRPKIEQSTPSHKCVTSDSCQRACWLTTHITGSKVLQKSFTHSHQQITRCKIWMRFQHTFYDTRPVWIRACASVSMIFSVALCTLCDCGAKMCQRKDEFCHPDFTTALYLPSYRFHKILETKFVSGVCVITHVFSVLCFLCLVWLSLWPTLPISLIWPAVFEFCHPDFTTALYLPSYHIHKILETKFVSGVCVITHVFSVLCFLCLV